MHENNWSCGSRTTELCSQLNCATKQNHRTAATLPQGTLNDWRTQASFGVWFTIRCSLWVSCSDLVSSLHVLSRFEVISALIITRISLYLRRRRDQGNYDAWRAVECFNAQTVWRQWLPADCTWWHTTPRMIPRTTTPTNELSATEHGQAMCAAT